MEQEFMTWDKLLTFSGLVLSTCVITSFIKGFFERIPTQFISWIIAFILLMLASIVTLGNGMPYWHEWILAAINSITISLTANGAHSVCTRKKDTGEG